jgi:hypothetical protein
VTLTVTDADGDTASTSVRFRIDAPAEPPAEEPTEPPTGEAE